MKSRDDAGSDTVWVTGAGGLIGSYLCRLAPAFAPLRRVIGLTRAVLDLTDFRAVQERFRQENPQLIIHCAALSKSPDCQANPNLARQINVEVTRQLSDLASENAFIFFSTDLVFDGTRGNYHESALVNPLSIYSETKASAEQIVLKHPQHTIIRTSLNGGTSPTGDRGFNEDLRRLWQGGQKVRLFIDEFRSPLPAAVTARAVWELASANRPGVYHLAGSERLSRLEIGKAMAARWPQLNPRIEPCSLKSYQGPPRSPDTSLDCRKVQQLLSFRLPGLREWLEQNPNEPF